MIPKQEAVERIIEADECNDKGMDDEGYFSSRSAITGSSKYLR
jgi:hypothetical protein